MPILKRTTFSQIMIFTMLLLGIGILAISAFYVSSFLAILGVTIIFWDAILLYVTPSKHVPLTWLNSSAEPGVANIERLIVELNLFEKGVYLPPRNLNNIESSLVFIPKTPNTPLPTSEEINEKQLTSQKTGAFITPPGLFLSRILEEELGFPLTKINLNQLQTHLPKLLVEGLELAEKAELQILGNTVAVEITGSILDDICIQTDSHPQTHKQVGCLLSSAIACTLAKSSGKPITIFNELRNKETKTTRMEFKILEG